ncbi:Blue-light-activated histidine kinase 1 [Jannaschia seosinensis]|uniref:histidine kinase n=1 Tax=Jannaschia seosinensis TaxID=313367 RepID=A0A0M7B9T3_9RHOB|nr:PAS domain-containing protein [Jannaschia seosinensis]CUH39557.1 Blue-light-activated histidine kinase 1 [Jannaschia seosinensis]
MRDGKTDTVRSVPVVAVGGSADGIDAVIGILSRFRPSDRAACIVIQHRELDRKPALHDLLQAECAVPVLQILHDELLRPGHIHVLPPGRIAELEGDVLHLLDRAGPETTADPFDHFLESLARARGRDGHAVILPGAGPEGAAGLRAIKESGGRVITQKREGQEGSQMQIDEVEMFFAALHDEREEFPLGPGPMTGVTEPLRDPANLPRVATRPAAGPFPRGSASPFAVLSGAGEVRFLSPEMRHFAQPAPSKPMDAVLIDDLHDPVRDALSAAARSGEERTVEDIRLRGEAGGAQTFDITVSPMRPDADEYLLVLTEVPHLETALAGETADRDPLELENARLRRELAATLAASRASGQDLRRANREFEAVNSELRENNQQLQRANSDLKNLFEATDLAILFLDRDLRVRNFTPATAALYTVAPRDIGRPISDLPSRIDYRELHDDAETVLATLRPLDREVRIPQTSETFLLRIKPYRTIDDRIDGYILSFADITIRQRYEQRLERKRRDLTERYAELENLYDTTPVGLALVDRGMKHVRINQMLADINGFSIEEHIGATFSDLMPDLAEDLEATHRHIFETGEPSLNNLIETTVPGNPNMVRSFLADFYPVFVDHEVHAVGTCMREVTDETRLLNEVAESEARMKRMFDASPVFIAIFEGPEHRYVYSNPLNDRIVGGRNLIGLPLLEAMPELEGQQVIEYFDRVYHTGERQAASEVCVSFDRNGDGQVEDLWIGHSLDPVLDGSGNVTGVISFGYELTEQIEARRRAEASERDKTLLLAELQHRVKNSLATVRAVSRLLLPGAEDARSFHDRLGMRLSAMARTHDLLTEADWVLTDLHALVVAEATPYERAPGRRVRIAGDPIKLDSREASAFGMALHEMMTNAAKYGALSNADGHVEVETTDGGEPGTRRLIWREVGGPPVTDPGDRRGFGSIVIEKVLVSDVKAEITMNYAPAGLELDATF